MMYLFLEYLVPTFAVFGFWLGIIYVLSDIANHRAYRRCCEAVADAAKSATERDLAVRLAIGKHLHQGTCVIDLVPAPKEGCDESEVNRC